MNPTFWSGYAKSYNSFMRKDADAYGEMFELIRPNVKGKIVLELATGTGLVAKGIIHQAAMIEATDSCPEMIAEARSICYSSKLHFSVQDICSLPYSDNSFSVIIAANVLHMITDPKKALDEMRRVLTDDGLLIIPTFTHGDSGFFAKRKTRKMIRAGFPLTQLWTEEEYLEFIESCGWKVSKSVLIKASIPLAYVECIKANNQ